MTAMQAQDLPGCLWSIGLRTPGSTRDEVENAFAAGAIVRSWPIRGTLHVVAAEDLTWILSLTSGRMIKSSLARRSALGITNDDLGKARAAAHSELGGGRSLERDALYSAFDAAGVSTTGQRGYHILWFLAQDGVLCLGPMTAGRQSFVLVDEWITNHRSLDRDEALGEFVYRYFNSHGTATIRDFAWWSSMTITDARVGLSVANSRLARVTRDGDEYYFCADAPSDLDTGTVSGRDGVRMLPGFDEYILGYQSRSPQLDADHAERIVPGGNGVFRPTILDDGLVVGTWTRSTTTRGVSLDTQLFSTQNSRTTDGIARASAKYARFLGLTLTPGA